MSLLPSLISLRQRFFQKIELSVDLSTFFPKNGNFRYNSYMKGNTNNKRIIEDSLNELDSTIQRLEKSLKLAPAEAITYRTIRGVCHFYQENPDGSEEYLGSDKEDRIRVLVKKKYEKMLLSAAKAEQEIFKRALKGFKTSKKYRTMNQVVEDFPEVFKEYLILDESTDAGSIQKWSKPIEPSIDPNDPKYSSFRTMRGETVRSNLSQILPCSIKEL